MCNFKNVKKEWSHKYFIPETPEKQQSLTYQVDKLFRRVISYLIDVKASPELICRVVKGITNRVKIRITANGVNFKHKVRQVVLVS